MSDEPSQSTPQQPEDKSPEIPVVAPPLSTSPPKAPPVIPQGKPATPGSHNQGLVNPVRILLAVSIIAIGAMLAFIPPLYIEDYWEENLWRSIFSLVVLLLIGVTVILNINATNVLTIFRCLLAFGIPLLVGLALWAPSLTLRSWDWPQIWTIILLLCCGLFTVMSIMVIIGGAFDVRKLLRRLREQENNGDPDPTH